MKTQNGILLPIVAVAVFIVLIVGVGYYFTLQNNPKISLLNQSPVPKISNEVFSTPQTTVLPVSTSEAKVDEKNWKAFTHASGNYSIKYPSTLTLHENQTSSVDGVKVDSKNTIELLPTGLTIKFKPVNQNLNDYLAANSWCGEITPEKGKQFLLDDAEGLIFENTNCGPWGITEIDVISKGTLYTIGIIKDDAEARQIISTFQFAD